MLYLAESLLIVESERERERERDGRASNAEITEVNEYVQGRGQLLLFFCSHVALVSCGCVRDRRNAIKRKWWAANVEQANRSSESKIKIDTVTKQFGKIKLKRN
jgi:hypothetical protein